MEYLKNDVYKKFVEQHILRPYQSNIVETKIPLVYTMGAYCILPDYFNDFPIWREKVFSRISEIFSSVDANVFPPGLVGMIILVEMHKKGVKIIYK